MAKLAELLRFEKHQSGAGWKALIDGDCCVEISLCPVLASWGGAELGNVLEGISGMEVGV